MTLDEMLLQKLAEKRPDTGRQTITLTDETGWTAALTADCCDQVGCRIWELALTRKSGIDLTKWTERATAKVTGLLEPLKLIEIDSERQIALMRSQAPTQRAENLFYYELTMRGEGVVVQRYQGSHKLHTRREQVAFALTHEALAKLVADLIASA